jgi:hypothetical protein
MVRWSTAVGKSNDLDLRTLLIADSACAVAHPLPAENHKPIKMPLQQQ